MSSTGGGIIPIRHKSITITGTKEELQDFAGATPDSELAAKILSALTPPAPAEQGEPEGE